ncbi:hypothetical protein AB0C28_30865 [Nonomuraea sp. NPDC048892]|uniref:hypothetical protein n=1 Tax=Nonomuraea sp. NPDC048892 TaxID=3154624 RepID=UPI0033EFBD87
MSIMTTSSAPRSSAEIRAYLKDQLNQALRRPGMYGDEIALRLLFDHLAYAEHQDEEFAQALRTLTSRGAFNGGGVTGAISTVLPDSSGHGVASIYAELAHDREWLQADRTLTPDEYADMRRTLVGWAAHDRTFTDVRELFGPPSLLIGGTNPYFGKTLAYLTSHAAAPIVFFHFWNGSDSQAEKTRPPIYDEPVLLAVRAGRGAFKDTFTFTPEGDRRRPARHPATGA